VKILIGAAALLVFIIAFCVHSDRQELQNWRAYRSAHHCTLSHPRQYGREYENWWACDDGISYQRAEVDQ
jgi:hypothetical protein